MERQEKIASYMFSGNARMDGKRDFTMADYKKVSSFSGYYYENGIYKLMGHAYMFRNSLKRFWFKNGGSLSEAYATSKTDLIRVLRAHYNTIYSDFEAVEMGVK